MSDSTENPEGIPARNDVPQDAGQAAHDQGSQHDAPVSDTDTTAVAPVIPPAATQAASSTPTQPTTPLPHGYDAASQNASTTPPPAYPAPQGRPVHQGQQFAGQQPQGPQGQQF